VITGAAGFLGLALTRTFGRAGYAVLAIDSVPPEDFNPRRDTPLAHVRYLRADVTDRTAIRAAVRADAAVIIHAAALTPTLTLQQEDPERIADTNLGGTLNLLAAARRAPGCTFIYISSAAVYDQEQHAVLREEDATGGSSLYGATKLAAELLVARYGQLFDFATIIVRPTSLYGPGEWIRSSRPAVTPVHRLIEAARRGRPVRLEGRDARGDWLFVVDAADAVLLLAGAGLSGRVFNLSTGRPRPFGDLARAVAATLPLAVDPAAETVVDGGADRPAIIANDRLRAAIDWAPCDLEEGIWRAVRAGEGS
jgi:nucleoside-diphosphate-sugar epimerase